MTQKSVKDYYAILGVLPTASLEEIRLAYRRQARAYHPDLSTDPHAEDRFKEINEAYDVLANSEKRQAYDYFTADAPETPPTTEEPQPAAAPAQETASESPRPRIEPMAMPKPGRPRRRVNPPTWAILLIVLGACIIIGVVVGGVLSLQRNRPTGGDSGGADRSAGEQHAAGDDCSHAAERCWHELPGRRRATGTGPLASPR